MNINPSLPDDVRARITREKQAAVRAERLRIRELGKDAAERGQSGEDFGASGPAQRERPHRLTNLEAVSRGTVAPGRRVEVKHMTCECQLDWLYVSKLLNNGIDGVASDETGARRWGTGIWFRTRWLASRHASRVSGAYGERLGGGNGLNEAEYRTQVRSEVDEALSWLSDPQKRAMTSICGEDRRAGLMLPTLIKALDQLHDRLAAKHKRRARC